jgi:hypothetical protein
MKRFHLLVTLSLFTPACIDATADEDGIELDETAQATTTVDGCSIYVNLANETTPQSVGVHAARYTYYHCDEIQVTVRTTYSGRNWNARILWTGDADYEQPSCQGALAVAAYKRIVFGQEQDDGAASDWGEWYNTGSFNGSGFPIYKCHEPELNKTLYDGRQYRLDIVTIGRDRDPGSVPATYHNAYEPFRIDLTPL